METTNNTENKKKMFENARKSLSSLRHVKLQIDMQCALYFFIPRGLIHSRYFSANLIIKKLHAAEN